MSMSSAWHDAGLLAPTVLTVVGATALSYLLSWRSAGSATARSAAEPARYFQDVVGSGTAEELGRRSGSVQGCEWTQTSAEVEVTAPLAEGVRAKDIECRALPSSIRVAVSGAMLLQGTLFRKVDDTSTDWVIEGKGGSRELKITLTKAVATKGGQHWTSLLVPEQS